METRLSPLTKTEKSVINTIAAHLVMQSASAFLKRDGCPNTGQLAANVFNSLTYKQHQIIRALDEEVRDARLELAEAIEQGGVE